MNSWIKFTRYINPKSKVSKKVTKSSIITILTQFFKFFNQIITLAILAHLLTPKDFGLVAMATGIISIVRMFVGQAFTRGIVQQPKLSHAQLNFFFWIVLFISSVLTFVFIKLSVLVGIFYKNLLIVKIFPFLSFQIFFAGLTFFPLTILQRRMEFEKISRIEIISGVSSKVIAIIMAFTGFKYWSLVAMELSYDGIRGGLSWYECKWRPDFKNFNINRIFSLFNFGLVVSIGSIFRTFSMQIDNILLGKYINSSVVGLYSKSINLTRLPIRLIIWPMERVSVSSLAKLHDKKEEFVNTFLNVSKYSFLILAPVFAILIMESKEIVLILLGDKWVSAIPIISLSAVYYLIAILEFPSDLILLVKGNLKRIFLWNYFITSLVRIGSIIIGLKWGVMGVITSLIIGKIFYQPIYTYFSLKDTNIKFLKFFSIYKESALAIFISIFLVFFIKRKAMFLNEYISFIIFAFLIIIIYLLILAIFPSFRKEIKEIKKMFIKR